MSEPTNRASAVAGAAEALAKVLQAQAGGTPGATIEPQALVTGLSEPVKPGYKTTEFWLTALHSVVALYINSGLDSSMQIDPTVKETTLLGAGLSLVAYIVSRLFAKR